MTFQHVLPISIVERTFFLQILDFVREQLLVLKNVEETLSAYVSDIKNKVEQAQTPLLQVKAYVTLSDSDTQYYNI